MLSKNYGWLIYIHERKAAIKKNIDKYSCMFECWQVGFLINKPYLVFIISLGPHKRHKERICYETTT